MLTTPTPAQTISHHRRARQLTAAQLAAQVGVSEASIRSYEQGRRLPRLEVVERLQDALGVRLVRAPRRRRNQSANSEVS